MRILGISGTDGTIAFTREPRALPGEGEARIVQGLDSAAALLVDGEFVAGVAKVVLRSFLFRHDTLVRKP